MFHEAVLRHAIVETGNLLESAGLVQGKTGRKNGNMSVRVPDGSAMLITPSGVGYSSLKADDIVRVELDGGGHWTGPLRPSIEWRFHCDSYLAYESIQAIVHTHSPYGTARAISRRPIPAHHYEALLLGGSVPVADFAPPGSEDLSHNLVEALRGRKAALLANHGVVAVGVDLDEALANALLVEHLAHLAFLAEAQGATILSDDDLERTREAIVAGYGQPKTVDQGV